jgi:hypothetical protein
LINPHYGINDIQPAKPLTYATTDLVTHDIKPKTKSIANTNSTKTTTTTINTTTTTSNNTTNTTTTTETSYNYSTKTANPRKTTIVIERKYYPKQKKPDPLFNFTHEDVQIYIIIF